LSLVELELAVVHDPTDRRVRRRCNLYEVEVEASGDLERFGERLDAELATVWIDESDFSGADSVVDTVLNGAWRGDRASLLFIGYRVFLCTSRGAGTTRKPRRTPNRPGAPSLQGGGRVEAPVGDPASVLNEDLGYTHDDPRPFT
jgi:hypothetical protein